MRFKTAIEGLVLSVALGGAFYAYGDTVILKSGDVFSGTITRIDADSIDVTTPFAGAIHVRRDTVKTLRSDGQVNIISADGTSHQAFLSPVTEGTGWQETAASAPPIPPPVVALAPPPALVAPKMFAPNLEPFFLPVGPHWKDQFVLGLVNTTGNTDSTNFASEVNFHYDEKPAEFTMKIGGVYAVTNGVQNAGQFYFDAVYRRTLPEWDKTERWYVSAENHELYDAIKGISLRSTTGASLGYYFFKTDKFTMDMRAGPAYVYQENFGGHSTSDISALVGLRAVYNVNERVSVSEEALYTVSVEYVDRYQISSETALNLKLPELARGLGLKFAFRDDYDQTAAPPHQENDTRLTLAITFDF
jgi:putative salt-induced outer membrane protein YdiY